MAQINTTPLVDVMLVLLIIFLITIPVVHSTIAVQLPAEAHQPREAKLDNIVITVDANGHIYWNDQWLPSGEGLVQSLSQAAQMKPQPELHIRADSRVEYDAVGRVVHAAQAAGLVRIGFVTQPGAGGR